MAALRKFGGEFAVDSRPGYQFLQATTALGDGRWLATWTESPLGAGGTRDVYAQLFDRDGAKIGSDFKVNTLLDNEQIWSTATRTADGGVLVAWQSTIDNLGSTDVKAQRFTAGGVAVGTEYSLTDRNTSFHSTPKLTTLTGGGIVATWVGGGGGSQIDIYAAFLDGNGARTGAQFIINGSLPSLRSNVEIAALGGGGFAAVWNERINGSDTARVQVFAADGRRVGGETVVSTRPNWQLDTSVIGLDDGSFVIAYAPLTVPFGFGFGPPPEGETYAQRFSATGAKLGSEILVNTTQAGPQFLPSLAALPDNRWFVAWDDSSRTLGDGEGRSIKGQVFEASGAKVGGELLINTTTAGDQFLPAVTALGGGRLVVTWGTEIRIGDGNTDGNIFGQILDIAPPPVIYGGNRFGNTYVAAPGFDYVLDGFGGNDTLTGASGSDVLRGGVGNDRLYGLGGDDVFEVARGDGFDTIDGGTGFDRILATGNDVTIGVINLTGVEAVSAQGFSGVTISGNAYANVIDLSGAMLEGIGAIRGLGGPDTITGSLGDDVIVGGLGRDVLSGGGGRDIFEGLGKELQGDTLLDFGSDDTLRFMNFASSFERLTIEIRPGVLRIDADGPGGMAPILVNIAGLTVDMGYGASIDSSGNLSFSLFI